MTDETPATFVYVTYIRTTPEKLWDALIKPEFNRLYWFGFHQDCGWTKGSPWKLMMSNGTLADSGEVLEIEPLKRIVIRWRNEFRPELKADGYTRCTFDIAVEGGTVRLSVTHEAEHAGHKVIAAVSGGWPKVLSSLKSLLETGTALPRPDAAPRN